MRRLAVLLVMLALTASCAGVSKKTAPGPSEAESSAPKVQQEKEQFLSTTGDKVDIPPPRLIWETMLGRKRQEVSTVSQYCISGYMFVVARGGFYRGNDSNGGSGASVVQVYEERGGKVVPMRCEMQ